MGAHASSGAGALASAALEFDVLQPAAASSAAIATVIRSPTMRGFFPHALSARKENFGLEGCGHSHASHPTLWMSVVVHAGTAATR
jgi:hypothetical protein